MLRASTIVFKIVSKSVLTEDDSVLLFSQCILLQMIFGRSNESIFKIESSLWLKACVFRVNLRIQIVYSERQSHCRCSRGD